MAKEKDMDRLFRDKLGAHSVQPSPLSWGKLEGRLSQRKKGASSWMRIAASLLLLGGLTTLLWWSLQNSQRQLETVADQEPLLEISPQEVPAIQELPPVEDQKEEEAPPRENNPAKKSPHKVVKPLAVVQPAEPGPPVKEPILVQEVERIELPPLDTDLLVAANTFADSEVTGGQEVEYKVTIISSGIKTTPEKETLVGEIENKIDKIGGLIGRMDQGFADLQDAKNNLFASITTRK